MDATSYTCPDDVTGGGAQKDENQSGSITCQPTANGTPACLSLGMDNGALTPPPKDRNPQQNTNQKQVSSTKRHVSCKTNPAPMKEASGDECCLHCLLACLYCELLSMCSAMTSCLVCGVGVASCCETESCCSCCVGACTDETCAAVLDCTVLEDCCASADCLEICSECCSICFPS